MLSLIHAKLAATESWGPNQLSSALHQDMHLDAALRAAVQRKHTVVTALSVAPWPVFPLILGFERKPYASPLYWRRRCSR